MKKQLFPLLFLFLGSFVFAQNTSRAVPPDLTLVFAEDESLITLTVPGKPALPVELGMSIPTGATLRTNGTDAELQLVPNGTIIKLTKNTVFKVEAVAGRDMGTSNNFALAAGKLRTVAAKLTGGPTPYSIRTPTAVGAVRGTDFAMLVTPGEKDWLCVLDGLVEFTRTADGETLNVAKNQFVDTFGARFAPVVVPASRINEIFSDIQFTRLNPATVPGHVAAPAAPAEEKAEEEPKDETTDSTVLDNTTQEETPAEDQAAKPKDPLMAFLADVLGFQVGSITINGTTYAKALIQPKIELGKVKLGLYLPVIYSKDLFNPDDWYQPKGNNEWSFGTDQTEPLDMVADGLSDLMLKIRYFEYGDQAADPFYIKLGNLKTMTLGHGSLVKNFANDQDFPAVRRLGINTGFTAESFAMEALFDDVTDLQVVGGRMAYVAGGFQLGVSGVVDLHAAKDYDPLGAKGNYGDPLLIAGGMDMQLFKADLGVISTTGFVDAGTVTAYFREAVPTTSVGSGFALETIYGDQALKSIMASGGVYGKILGLMDYDLEVRFTKGLAKIALFDAVYNRTKVEYVDQIVNYLDSTVVADEVDASTSMGVYGSAGFNLFDFLIFKGAYFWPWTWNGDGTVTFAEEDSLELKLDIPKGKIPFVDLYGSVGYTRTKFIPTILGNLGDSVTLFDANTVLAGEIIYGMVEGMDLAIQVSTAVVTDSNGQALYEDGKKMIRPSINIETRISF